MDKVTSEFGKVNISTQELPQAQMVQLDFNIESTENNELKDDIQGMRPEYIKELEKKVNGLNNTIKNLHSEMSSMRNSVVEAMIRLPNVNDDIKQLEDDRMLLEKK